MQIVLVFSSSDVYLGYLFYGILFLLFVAISGGFLSFRKHVLKLVTPFIRIPFVLCHYIGREQKTHNNQ